MTNNAKLSAMLLLLAGAAVAAGSEPRPIDTSKADRGRDVYGRYCISCHGGDGDGRGYSAHWLDPAPRDFTGAVFKWRSTPSGALPSEEDILRTLKGGLYHTNMPPWAVLGERDLRDVVEYLKTFSPRWRNEPVPTAIVIPLEPPDTRESRAAGAEVYKSSGCANCHGEQGKGDGPSAAELKDDWGHRIAPFDMTRSEFLKCGGSPKDVYRVLMTGLNGTPMPSFADQLKAEEAWQLVHFVRSVVRPDSPIKPAIVQR